MSQPSHLSRNAWVLSMAAALAFLLVDSAVRLRGVNELTAASVGSARSIAADSASRSGYEMNQHNVVLPILGTDGYHWAMQTQEMIATGSARVRWVDYDGPPGGRAVHWSSLLRWWTAAFAWVSSKVSGVPLAVAVERVSPWVNTVFLGILLLTLAPVIARRFGYLPASLFALGVVAVHPVYEFYVVGYYDHHGLASTAAMLSVLFLLAGGAGWVRDASAARQRLKGDELATWEWLPDESAARRWFIASGIAGGAGLWISAATQIPALLGIGVAALAGAGALARGRDAGAAWRVEPGLWRVWGIAGAISSLFFYLLEYFPSHMGLRLEVNNPLYAVAWFGAGDLLFRLCGTLSGQEAKRGTEASDAARVASRHPAPGAAWIVIDVVLLGLVPAIVLLVPESFTLRPGSFIMALHEQYIDEFRGLPRQVAGWSWAQVNAGVGLLPLLMIGPASALSLAKRVARPLRALAILGLLPALVFTVLAFRQGRWLGIGCALWLCTLVAVATVATAGHRDAWNWPVIRKVTIGIAMSLVAAVIPILLFHLRHVAGTPASGASTSIAAFPDVATSAGPLLSALLIALVALAAVLPGMALVRGWTSARLVCSGAFLGLVLAPFPALSAYKWTTAHWVYPLTSAELTEVATRDVARKLRARLGTERGVVASGPTTTTWMTWFGGFKGIGTLYWENHAGLEESAMLFGAVAPYSGGSASDAAYAQVKHLGVTHIVLFSWGPFTTEYARLARALRASATPIVADDSATRNAFGPQLLKGNIPAWLRPLPYRVPPMAGVENPWVWILEVTPGQAPKEAATRFAQFSLAMNDEAGALRQLDAALRLDPGYVPALISLARLQFADPARGGFSATLQRLRAAHAGTGGLALEDEIGLASVYVLAGDSTRAREVVARAIREADERSIRRLPWDYTPANFIVLARQFNLLNVRPDIMKFTFDLLDPDVRAQLTQASRTSTPGSPR